MTESPTTLDIDGLKVIFPYKNPYPEQIEYMTQMKLALDATGPCVLEMPSGTGKTVCILSLIISYMSQNDEVGPLVYCTRTIPELEQGIAELKNVHKTRLSLSDSNYDKNFLGIALSARINLCIHPEASEQNSKAEVDSLCVRKTIPWSETRCDFFDHELLRPRPGVYGLSDLKQFSYHNGICPYYLSRRLVREANVIMGSFAYALDPGASEILFKAIPKSAIVVFDEAHNIDDVCCEYLSTYLDTNIIEKAAQSLDAGQKIAREIRQREQARLQNAFEKLKEGLEKEKNDIGTRETLEILSHPMLPAHVLDKAMPSSLQNFDDFIDNARKLIRFFAAFIKGIEKPEGGTVLNDTLNQAASIYLKDDDGDEISLLDKQIECYTTQQVIAAIKEKCDIDENILLNMPPRFSKFLSKNKVPDIDTYQPLISALDFGKYIAECNYGYTVFVELTPEGPLIQLNCLDPKIAFRAAQSHFSRIVITSGTLSPLPNYPLLLGFEPVSMVDFTMSFSRRCLLPIIVTQGDDKTPLSSSFRLRSNPKVAKNYGELLLRYCQLVPDGIICFFPSYVYLKLVFNTWYESGLIKEVMQYKLVFLETPSTEETSIAFENYRKSIENGRGALFLGVARGRISEGIDFSDHYGRCVLLFGLPVRNTMSMLVQTRAEFVETEYGMDRHEFLLFDAMRAASQCVGRLLRSKNDYGIVVMADKRYAREQLRTQLPHWIKQFLNDNKTTASIEQAVEQTSQFLLQMAQPFIHNPEKLLESVKATKK